jgi:hypothetical protein
MRNRNIMLTLIGTIVAFVLAQDPSPTYTFKPRPYLVNVPETAEDKAFLAFADLYQKSYTSTSDFEFRREIYKRNMKLIAQA